MTLPQTLRRWCFRLRQPWPSMWKSATSMGDAWCDKNPEAFATLVHAAAINLLGATIGKELGKLSNSMDRVSQQLDAITD